MLKCKSKQSVSTFKGPVSSKSNSRSISNRETKIFLFKLVQTYTISEYPKYCSRIWDSFSRKPCAGKITESCGFEPGTIQACQGETQGNVVKRCNTASIAMQQSLSCIKELWEQQTSNKFEKTEEFHPIPAFQNGGTELITKYAPEGKPYVQAGPKRRPLLCSSKKGIK